MTTDPAWAAGLFEGEGWLYIKATLPRDRRSTKFTLTVGMTNTDPLLLAPYGETWGGRIRPRKGTVLSRKPLLEWRVEARRAEAFLCAILPHIRGAKRSKIEAAVALSQRMRPEWRARMSDGRIRVLTEEELTWRQTLRRQTSA